MSGSLAEERQSHPHALANRPGRCHRPAPVGSPHDPGRRGAPVTAARGEGRYAGNHDSAATRDVWQVLARARTDHALRTLAAAQDAVFRRYLPMARTLAHRRDSGGLPAGCADAERAAELGLAQAVLGWRRTDGDGFELFAGIAIAAQLERRPVASKGAGLASHRRPGGLPAGGEPRPVRR